MRQYSFLDIFPTPQYLLLSSTGVTISDKSISVVEFRRSGKGDRGLILSRLGSTPLPEGAMEFGVIKDRDAVINTLKEIQKRHRVRYVRATFPEERAYLFTTEVEKVSGGNLHDQVAFTIEENVPVRLSESVFDFDIVSESSERVKVAVTVLPIADVETFTEVFESAGMMPIGFDITPQAISRALTPRGDKRTFLILNIGELKTGLYVVADGVVQFSSTVTLGAREDPDFPDMDALRTEVQKLFAFWSERIDKVILSGHGAANQAFVDRLMADLGVDYAVGDIWASASPIEKYVPDIPFNTSLSYAAPVGTALPSKRAKMFKLLPPDTYKGVGREYMLRRMVVMLWSLIIILAVGIGILMPSAFISAARRSDAVTKETALENSASIQDSQNLRDWVINTNKKLALLSPDKDTDKPYEILLTILGQKVSGIHITGLTYQNSNKKLTIEVVGVASTRQTLLSFESALNDLNQFSKVELPVSDFAQDQDVNFNLTLTPTH